MLRMKPIAEKTCVLYDPSDGRILHTHQVLTFPGGRTVTDDEVEARARARSTHMGKPATALHVLHIAAMEHDGASVYRVDLRAKKLVKIEPPIRLVRT